MRRYITYIIALLFAISCSKENSPSIEQEEVRNVAFNMKTKVDSELRDYCFALYYPNQDTEPQYGFYGSKILSSADENNKYQWLEPIAENGNLGLAAAVGAYAMSVVSPAMKPSSAKGYWWLDLSTSSSKIDGIEKDIFGYQYNRIPQDSCASDKLFMGDPASIYIESALASPSSDEITYNYKFNDSYTLKQQRTKLQLKARAKTVEGDESIQLSYNIRSIYIYNVVNTALFNPTVGYYAIGMLGHLYPFADFDDNNEEGTIINWPDPRVLKVTEEEDIDSENYFYLISADYSNRVRYPITPTLKVEFKNSSGSIRTASIMLDINFKPQHYYIFDLTIGSNEITLSTTVEDWDKHNVTDEVLELDKSTITATIEDDNNWENGGAITGDIDDIIDNK